MCYIVISLEIFGLIGIKPMDKIYYMQKYEKEDIKIHFFDWLSSFTLF